MLELRIKQGRRSVPLFDLPAFLGRDDAAREIGDAIDGLIAFLDDLGGDPDLEATGAEDDFMDHPLAAGIYEHGPGCPVADPDFGVEEGGERSSYAEWHTLPAVRRRAGHIDGRSANDAVVDEDAEDDDQDTSVEDGPEGFDPEEDCCTAGDDRVMSGAGIGYTSVNDNLKPGSDDDAEREQMQHDVPMLPIYALDSDTDRTGRQFLGRSNMMSSFRTNGQPTISADSGNAFMSKGWAEQPGQPV